MFLLFSERGPIHTKIILVGDVTRNKYVNHDIQDHTRRVACSPLQWIRPVAVTENSFALIRSRKPARCLYRELKRQCTAHVPGLEKFFSSMGLITSYLYWNQMGNFIMRESRLCTCTKCDAVAILPLLGELCIHSSPNEVIYGIHDKENTKSCLKPPIFRGRFFQGLV